MKSVVVIRLGRLGDVLLTGPTIKNLRFLYPDANIVLVTREAYQNAAAMLPGLSDCLTFPDNGSYLDLMRLSSRLDDYAPDLIVDLHKNFRSFHLAALSRAPFKVVYHKRRTERLAAVNEKKFLSPIPHTIDLYNQVIVQLNGEILARRPDISLSQDVFRGTLRDGVVLAPGASSPIKSWPTAWFAGLAERIIGELRQPMAIVLGPRDEALQKAFAHLPPDAATIYFDRPLNEIAALLARSRLTVTNDSGLMHLSSGTGTPTAAIFGPTHEQLGFYPLGLHDTVISVDETCRPCSLHGNKPCYREEQYCFTRLTVDVVYAKIAPLLARTSLRPAAFLDRDGTVIEDKQYLADPARIAFLPQALEGIRRLKQAGYVIAIVSNQSGVARGFFPTATVDAVHDRLRHLMQAAGCEPDDIRFCPHLPDGDDPAFRGDCACRKPKPGMLEETAAAMRIDLKRSVMIGDKSSDIICGRAAGTNTILVRTGNGRETEKALPEFRYLRPDAICDDLAAAADFILLRP